MQVQEFSRFTQFICSIENFIDPYVYSKALQYSNWTQANPFTRIPRRLWFIVNATTERCEKFQWSVKLNSFVVVCCAGRVDSISELRFAYKLSEEETAKRIVTNRAQRTILCLFAVGVASSKLRLFIYKSQSESQFSGRYIPILLNKGNTIQGSPVPLI